MITPEYLQTRPLSYSSLSQFKRSPLHYIHYISQPKKEPTPEMLFGSLVDCLVWTPDKFDERFMVMPEINRRTKKGKKEYEELQRSCNKKLIRPEDYNLAKRIKAEIESNESSSRLIKEITESQKEIRWIDKETELPLIAVQDGACDDYIVELKTTRNAESEAFSRDAFWLGYPLQCAMYVEATKKPFFYLVVEKEEPFGISVLKASSEYIEYGKKQLRSLLNDFKYCLNNNLWLKGYGWRTDRGYEFIELPSWAKKF